VFDATAAIIETDRQSAVAHAPDQLKSEKRDRSGLRMTYNWLEPGSMLV
jgi:hypothetical protein